MKPDIHPEYKVGTVTCACGNSFQVRSTVGDMTVEICSACHPFFTGKQKLIDSAGRVEKFMKKYGMVDKKAADAKDVDVKAETKVETKAEEKAETVVAEAESEKIEDKEAVINS